MIFFSSGVLKALKIKLSVSFLDGMHLFEYLLRDFINTEKFSDPNGVIFLHDCCPFSHEMTTRDLDNLPRGAWAGDVWKLIPILKDLRPDLNITVLDAQPTGMVIISNLSPGSQVLRKNYDDIVDEYMGQTLESFGLSRFYDLFDFTSTSKFINDSMTIFASVSQDAASISVPKKITP